MFKEVVEMMKKGEHLTIEGLAKVAAFRASMNKGLSKELQEAFPSIISNADNFLNFKQ